jgi:penicillin-binding protein 1C
VKVERPYTYIKKYRLLIALAVLFILFIMWLPSKLFDKPISYVLVSEKGELMGAKIADDGQWRFPESDSVPFKFRKCLLTFEDEYFEYHPGVNPVSLFRSLKQNINSGSAKRGGSTITMQVARMMRGNRERTVYQKLVEITLAVRIECSYRKSSILKIYVCHAPFGSNVVGLSAASWRYFGRYPHQLSWAEAATLAVLPNAPSLIYPGKNQRRLLEKRNRLLAKLRTNNTIDQSTYELALMESLPAKPFPIPQLAPHLLVRAAQEEPEQRLFRTTLDKDLQVKVAELVNRHMSSLSGNQVYNAGVIVAETETGKVLAYIGNCYSETNAHENYVDVIRAPRSTGSILKPFLYAFMLSEGRMLPASLVEDVPTRLGSYGPKNYNLTYDGLVPAHEAIARSLNVPAIKMLQDYGASRFHKRLKQLGFTTFNRPTEHYGLSLILGGGEATLWDIASAYSSMGRALSFYSQRWDKYAEGSYRKLHYIQGKENKISISQRSDLLSASSIYFTFRAMTELLRPQDYVGYKQFLSKAPIAWKTGTSFGFRDAWATGLNAKYTVAVWVGNADGEGRPELTGTSCAAPLMFSVFNVLSEKKWFQKPERDMEKVLVCQQSGYKASDICEKVETREYCRGSSKTKVCEFHKLVHLDQSGNYRVQGDCYPVSSMRHVAWFVASPVQEYFFKKRNLGYKVLPPFLPGCEPDENQKHLEIIYPRDNFQVYMPVDESGKKSRCILKATHKGKDATLFWYMDGVYIGATRQFHQVPLVAEAGKHVLEISDENGESSVCRFEVLSKS